MQWSSAKRAAILCGAQAAMREWVALGASVEEPVDVFGAVERAGLWLMFQPCEGIKGALCQNADVTGVLVNSNHPFHLQRFTAAHELGHYRLGHGEAIDLTGDDGDTRRLSGMELEAESFASYFLMHKRAVKHALGPATDISPADVYQAALRLQVSYAAMVSRLQELELVSFSEAQRLRAIPPKEIKQSLTHGMTGNPGRRHVWLAREQDQHRVLRPLPGDEVHIVIAEQPAAGYSWRETSESSAPVHRVATDSHFEPEHLGGPSERHIAYLVDAPGKGELILSQSRSWENAALASFHLHIEAEQALTGVDERGLAPAQLELLAARLE
jgi:predicted secreted protein